MDKKKLANTLVKEFIKKYEDEYYEVFGEGVLNARAPQVIFYDKMVDDALIWGVKPTHWIGFAGLPRAKAFRGSGIHTLGAFWHEQHGFMGFWHVGYGNTVVSERVDCVDFDDTLQVA